MDVNATSDNVHGWRGTAVRGSDACQPTMPAGAGGEKSRMDREVVMPLARRRMRSLSKLKDCPPDDFCSDLTRTPFFLSFPMVEVK